MSNTIRLLHVEDSEDDGALIARELERAGYSARITRVQTEEHFRAALERESWDLVLSDFSMPGFNGTAALRLLRERDQQTPFIFVSGTIGEEIAVQAMRDGAQDYVIKGNLRRLAPAIAREIREAAGRRERQSLEQQLIQAQKMEAIGRLAGGVAHDFNNILGAIFMEIECALADLPPDHAVVEGLQQVRRAAEQAAGMTRQLLAFSRHQITENTVFTFNDVVTDAERMLRRLVGADVALSVRPASDIASVRADRGQVEQVLVNLVVNARDAMPEGGSLTIETENELVSEAYAAQHQDVVAGPFAVLVVTDTGTGMTPEIQAKIFEPFFTTKERGKGTGLGLATSYGIVKQAGGHIRLLSEPSCGTRFRIYLPAVSAPRTSRPVAASVVDLHGTETILLVEDSDLVRGAAVRILRAQGYRVLEAADGPSAVRQLEEAKEPIHLLLTDVVLPGIQGPEVAARALERRRDIRVLFSSGYSQDSASLQRLMDEGAALLPKPYTQDTLSRRVREVLDAPKPGLP